MDEEAGAGMIESMLGKILDTLEEIERNTRPTIRRHVDIGAEGVVGIGITLYHCQYSGCTATYYDMDDLRTRRNEVHGE